MSEPEEIKLNGVVFPQGDASAGNYWKWSSLEKGGTVSISYAGGNQIEVILKK
jgi:hypothetical protein